MRVEMRKTAAGTEYWDTEEKRTLFVPAGNEPDFEVTVNPKSMIMGVDLASGPDKTVIDGEVITPDLESMTVKQLRALAVERDIEIPADITKKDDIIKLLSESE